MAPPGSPSPVPMKPFRVQCSDRPLAAGIQSRCPGHSSHPHHTGAELRRGEEYCRGFAERVIQSLERQWHGGKRMYARAAGGVKGTVYALPCVQAGDCSTLPTSAFPSRPRRLWKAWLRRRAPAEPSGSTGYTGQTGLSGRERKAMRRAKATEAALRADKTGTPAAAEKGILPRSSGNALRASEAQREVAIAAGPP